MAETLNLERDAYGRHINTTREQERYDGNSYSI
jgi:hypothetical protein